MPNIRVAIVGVGNCASSLIQGIEYYKLNKHQNAGLIHYDIKNYKVSDIEVVAAFDVDKRKVSRPLKQAIFSEPNCTKTINEYYKDIPNIIVHKGPVLDGISDHMHQYFQVDINQPELTKDEILSIIEKSKTDVLINYLPVGSQKATEFWADISLTAKTAFINCIPVFISSNEIWNKKFKDANIPILGDDIKSQVGATIVHRSLIKTLIDRGANIDSTYQINIGGNTDFRNMLDNTRLESKKISKTDSIKSLIPYELYVYAGPNGCIDSLNDNKVCHLRIDFRIFGNIPASIDLKLSVEDSPNSAGIVIDAIRCAKLALDKSIGGPLPLAAYFFKHPPVPMNDEDSRKLVDDFINGNENDNKRI